MLVVIVIHDVKPGRLDQARRRIDGNTGQIARQPGMVFRHTGVADGNENRIVTVTGWRRAEDRRAWDALKRTLPVEADPRELLAKVQSFTFETYDERWRPATADAAAQGAEP
jgi:heme-degrading monooxygenase HmoA